MKNIQYHIFIPLKFISNNSFFKLKIFFNLCFSVRPKSNCGSDVGFDPNGNKDKAKAKRQRPGLAYANQPFQLVIRKQVIKHT
jgi:hypothetical protein